MSEVASVGGEILKIQLGDFGNLFRTDPKKLDDQELLSLDFILHRAWKTKRGGGRIHFGEKSWSFEDLINLHVFVVKEMQERAFKHRAPDELDRLTDRLVREEATAAAKADDLSKQEPVPKLTNDRARLRPADPENAGERCGSCQYFGSPKNCSVVIGPVSKDLVCDWIQSRDVKGAPRYTVSDSDWLAFGRGMVNRQPYQHIVVDAALTPKGPLVMIEDTAEPPHRFSLTKSFHVDHTSFEHHWTQAEVDDLIEAGREGEDIVKQVPPRSYAPGPGGKCSDMWPHKWRDRCYKTKADVERAKEEASKGGDSESSKNNPPKSSGVLVGIILEKIESDSGGAFDYRYGIDPENSKISPDFTKSVGGHMYLAVGNGFSTSSDFEIGDLVMVKFNALDRTENLKDKTVSITGLASEVLGLSDRKRPFTIGEAVKEARRNSVFQEKEITLEGEVISKVVRPAFGSPGGKRYLARKIEKQSGTTIQSLILSKDTFSSEAAARRWVNEHDFSSKKVDETENSFRYRQREPKDFKPNGFGQGQRFRTIPITDGVQAVIGFLR